MTPEELDEIMMKILADINKMHEADMKKYFNFEQSKQPDDPQDDFEIDIKKYERLN